MHGPVVASFVLAQREDAAVLPALARHGEEDLVRLGHGRHVLQLRTRLEVGDHARVGRGVAPHALEIVRVQVREPLAAGVDLLQPAQELLADGREAGLLLRARVGAVAGEGLEAPVEAVDRGQHRVVDEGRRRVPRGQELACEARDLGRDLPGHRLGQLRTVRQRRAARDGRVATGQDRGVRGDQLRRGRPGLEEHDALVGQLLQARHRGPVVAVDRDVVGAQGVDRDHQHPVPRPRGGRLGRAPREERGQDEESRRAHV